MPSTLTAPAPTAHPLDALFRPRSIAIVGASNNPRKIGGRPLAYLRESGFAGAIYPVNPGQDTVQGLPAYPSLAAIGTPVDQVIVAVAGAQATAAVEEAIAQQARTIIVFSSGFAELDEAGRAAQEHLAALCREAGVQLVGPNCIGVFSARNALYATFMSALEHERFPAGNVGIVTQSGAVGSYLYGLAGDRGLAFSHFVATGNEAGVDIADCIDWMADDPDTNTIMVYAEGCRDGQRLYDALQHARRQRKPVIFLKVGRSAQGAAAAASHTGALAGSDTVFDAILAETNTWRADTLEDMVDLAYACSIGPLPRGNRLGVITPSGGVGVIAADEAARVGLTLPALPAATQAAIREVVPFASGVNPVDTTGQTLGDRTLFTRILALVFEHEGFDSLLSFNVNMGRSESEFAKVRDDLYRLRRACPERLVAVSMRARPEIAAELAQAGILHFPDPARATATLGAMTRLAAGFDTPVPAAPPLPPASPLPAGDGPIDEAQARELLAAHGIAFAPQAIVTDAEAAVRAAEAQGYPVVLKIVSADIAHKSDVGGVRLHLRDADAVRLAWDAMHTDVRSRCPDAKLDGVLVSPMIQGGVETVMGVTRDPVFGPMVMFGLGGVFVEVFRDVTFRKAPVSLATAHDMIREIQGLPLLQGARGRPPMDLDTLAETLVRLSTFAASQAATVNSVEINPFIALPEGGCAVDALILR